MEFFVPTQEERHLAAQQISKFLGSVILRTNETLCNFKLLNLQPPIEVWPPTVGEEVTKFFRDTEFILHTSTEIIQTYRLAVSEEGQTPDRTLFHGFMIDSDTSSVKFSQALPDDPPLVEPQTYDPLRHQIAVASPTA